MIDKQKQNLNMKVQWAKFAVVLALYLLFLIWVESWLGLIVGSVHLRCLHHQEDSLAVVEGWGRPYPLHHELG